MTLVSLTRSDFPYTWRGTEPATIAPYGLNTSMPSKVRCPPAAAKSSSGWVMVTTSSPMLRASSITLLIAFYTAYTGCCPLPRGYILVGDRVWKRSEDMIGLLEIQFLAFSHEG